MTKSEMMVIYLNFYVINWSHPDKEAHLNQTERTFKTQEALNRQCLWNTVSLDGLISLESQQLSTGSVRHICVLCTMVPSSGEFLMTHLIIGQSWAPFNYCVDKNISGHGMSEYPAKVELNCSSSSNPAANKISSLNIIERKISAVTLLAIKVWKMST